MQFDRQQAEELLEVYSGVVPDFKDHVLQLAAGLSVAMEVRAESAVNTFRVTAGPWDVAMAKELRPGEESTSLPASHRSPTLRCLSVIRCVVLWYCGRFDSSSVRR